VREIGGASRRGLFLLAGRDDKEFFVFQQRYAEGGKEYLIRVAARLEGSAWVVLTAYKTSKVQKYWRDNL
jgi:hypothetical protein